MMEMAREHIAETVHDILTLYCLFILHPEGKTRLEFCLRYTFPEYIAK